MNKKKTPLTSHRVRETVEELLELLSKRQNEVAALRSELSAAQAQAKALSAIKKGLETSLTEALSSLSAAQEENKRLRELFESEDVAQQRMRENGD